MNQILTHHGSYKKLISYQNSVIIYDATVAFCRLFLNSGDRTTDQMIQAARSCKQNIAEGSNTSGTSKEGELKLTGVARASLQELLEDYQDYLRVHNLRAWDKSDERIREFRALNSEQKAAKLFREYFANKNPEELCNIILSLIYQTSYLIDRQIQSQQETFTKEGGLRERMYKARLAARNGTSQDAADALALLREIYKDVQQSVAPDVAAPILGKIKEVGRILRGQRK